MLKACLRHDGEGRLLAPVGVAAPHPNLLPVKTGRRSKRRKVRP